MNTKVIENNKNKLKAYVESYHHKFISLNIKDNNNFSFYFIPDSDEFSKQEIENMVKAVNEGNTKAFPGMIREAQVKLISKLNHAIIKVNEAKTFSSKNLNDMIANFENFIKALNDKVNIEENEK